MKIDPNTRVGSALLGAAGHLLRLLLWLIGATLRVEVVAGRELLAELQERPRPVILSFWHEQTFLAAHFLYRQLHRRGLDLTLLASQSRDGEMVTRMVKGWGIETVRGSSTRGGLKALRGIHRAVTRRGSSPIMVPDGPHGPPHVFKVGVAVLAQTTGAPILPLGFAAQSAWRLRSWDRLVIPRPFSRVAITLGDLQNVPSELSPEELEDQRRHLEDVINEVSNQARSALE